MCNHEFLIINPFRNKPDNLFCANCDQDWIWVSGGVYRKEEKKQIHKHNFDRIRFVGKTPYKQCGECKHEEPVKNNWNWTKFKVSIDTAKNLPDIERGLAMDWSKEEKEK